MKNEDLPAFFLARHVYGGMTGPTPIFFQIPLSTYYLMYPIPTIRFDHLEPYALRLIPILL